MQAATGGVKTPTTPPPSTTPVIAGQVMTGQDVQALRIRLHDMQTELQDAAERRQTISSELSGADPSARPGILSRMQELDSRILRLERDISATTLQLNSAPASALYAGTRDPFDTVIERLGDNIVPIVVVPSIFVLFPFVLAISRLIWKRGSAPRRAAVADPALHNRMEQLQQSVDTMAVEIERISEGQRFVTKLLNDRATLGAGVGGVAEPIRRSKQASEVERG